MNANSTILTSADVQLGLRYRDRITDFEGIATVKSEYLFGETRVLLEGPGDKKQSTGDGFFAVQRLIQVEGDVIDLGEMQRERTLSGTH